MRRMVEVEKAEGSSEIKYLRMWKRKKKPSVERKSHEICSTAAVRLSLPIHRRQSSAVRMDTPFVEEEKGSLSLPQLVFVPSFARCQIWEFWRKGEDFKWAILIAGNVMV
ncbi:hypothetical protein AVEN_135426-1 [Araneus ventricosus]|uniref:Uncharacterized protein n=1 Tax=Araneus ventricosus TaxID=182803 RepID=A0A4Y2BFH7_ARAVE|nr:hypothetical protein AVEN_135426-1 [Araneus ventricosus]